MVVDATGEVFGEAPNIAVFAAASVQRQTAGLFVVEDRGAHDLKGVTAPARARGFAQREPSPVLARR